MLQTNKKVHIAGSLVVYDCYNLTQEKTGFYLIRVTTKNISWVTAAKEKQTDTAGSRMNQDLILFLSRDLMWCSISFFIQEKLSGIHLFFTHIFLNEARHYRNLYALSSLHRNLTKVIIGPGTVTAKWGVHIVMLVYSMLADKSVMKR